MSNTNRCRRMPTPRAISTPMCATGALAARNIPAPTSIGRSARSRKMKAALLAAFEGWDYVIAPTLPVVNFPAEEPGVSRQNPLEHTLFTAMFNQTCQPASTVCMAFDSRHLPIGVQVDRPSVRRPRRIAGDESSGGNAVGDDGLAVSATGMKWRYRETPWDARPPPHLIIATIREAEYMLALPDVSDPWRVT